MEQIIAAVMAFIASITGGGVPALSSLPAAPGVTKPAPAAKTISYQRAFEIAYRHAGVNGGNVWDKDADLDRENGRLVWEIDFENRTHEWEYEIDAYTGAVVHHKRDWND